MTLSERFSIFEIKNIDTSGFDELTANDQYLLFHLSMAGNVARNIIYHQTSPYSLAVKEVLKDILLHTHNDVFTALQVTMAERAPGFDVKECIETAFKEVLISNGIYREGSGYRIQFDPLLLESDFVTLLENKNLTTSHSQRELAKIGLFGDIPNMINSGSLDIPSGFNSHSDKLTIKERKKELDKLIHVSKLFFGDKHPSAGINLYLDRTPDGEISYHRFSTKGRCAHELSRSLFHFKEALKYTEDRQAMYESILKLITFLEEGGEPFNYDRFNEAWIKDTDSNIFFAFGFIETYDDVIEHFGAFQSLAGFTDPTLTKMIHFITSKAQELEDSLPIDDRFKRKEAKGVNGSAVNLVNFTGDGGPVLALGNILPNGWVRNKIGSRSSAFSSSITARAVPSPAVCDAFLMPEYQNQSYLTFYYHLLVQLHECMGHASGDLLSGVDQNSLGEYGAIIEECRADLVALYHIGNKTLTQGILDHLGLNLDVDKLIETAYAQYLTDGLYFQLTRVNPESGEVIPRRLTTPHFRNRLLNAQVVMNHALLNGAITYDTSGGYLVKNDKIIIKDADVVRNGVANLLREIQRITSEGDKDGAKTLVDKFGTLIPAANYNSAMRRLEGIDIAKFHGFTTPFFMPTGDRNKPFTLKQAPSFIEDQLALDELAYTEILPDRVYHW